MKECLPRARPQIGMPYIGVSSWPGFFREGIYPQAGQMFMQREVACDGTRGCLMICLVQVSV